MKLTVQQVFDATPVLAKIIAENRPLPQKGAYHMARMHRKLLPEYEAIAARRDSLIMAFDHVEEGAALNSVPADKAAEFFAQWKEIAEEEIEVDVQAIPLQQLDLGDSVAGAIQASELLMLGDLVCDSPPISTPM